MNELWVHGLSGSLSALLTSSLLHPFELLRTRLQENRGHSSLTGYLLQLYKEGRLHSLYSGFLSTLVTSITSYGSYFLVYRWAQQVFTRRFGPLQVSHNLCVSFVASLACIVLNSPIWTINTRLMKEQSEYQGIRQCLVVIWQTEGLAGLYKGFVPSVLLASNPVIQFTLYEKLKQLLGEDLLMLTYFGLGVLSKLFATIATYPLLTVRTRIQISQEDLSMYSVAVAMLRTESFTAFYKGFSAKVIQSVLNSAFILSIHEKLTAVLLRLLHPSRLHSLAQA